MGKSGNISAARHAAQRQARLARQRPASRRGHRRRREARIPMSVTDASSTNEGAEVTVRILADHLWIGPTLHHAGDEVRLPAVVARYQDDRFVAAR
jgi:hypothetical protein